MDKKRRRYNHINEKRIICMDGQATFLLSEIQNRGEEQFKKCFLISFISFLLFTCIGISITYLFPYSFALKHPQRWEFVKENKKKRKKENKNFIFFIDHFLGRVIVFILFYLFSYFLVFFINSHLRYV